MVWEPGGGGGSEDADVGYKCLITVYGALEAGIHDRMYDRGWSCAVCLERAIRGNRLLEVSLQSNGKCLIWKTNNKFDEKRSHRG